MNDSATATDLSASADADNTPSEAQGEAAAPNAGEHRQADPAARAPKRANAGRQATGAKPANAAKPSNAAKQPRKANAVLERLFELHPKMFGARFLPLKLGAFQDILALHPDEFKREDLKIALGLHARSTRYLEAVASGHQRHDLDGNPVEPVAPEHVHHAIIEVFRRRQARSQADLRPQLKARLIEAIESSGLGREDYTLMAARMQDEVANAVLDEAFAEIGARTARREALRRAFEASGKSIEAFAEMYGMDLREVRRMLRPPEGAAT
ncbi:Prop effector [Burkholderiales bacterium 8X]|nr:Prop effector [Burkholderiales bacterium 8X]